MEDSCSASKAARPRNHQAAPRARQQHHDGRHGSHDAIGDHGWARLARRTLLQGQHSLSLEPVSSGRVGRLCSHACRWEGEDGGVDVHGLGRGLAGVVVVVVVVVVVITTSKR